MKISLALMLLLCAGAFSACSRTPQPAPPAERWMTDVQRLAADDMQGRGTGTDGYRKAADYVVERFKELGLQPAGTEGFLQPVAFQARTLLEEQSRLELVRGGKSVPLPFGSHTIAFPMGQPGALRAPMVFAGYGLTIPEYRHDDFANLAVAGKVVVMLQGAPPSVPSTVAAHYSSFEQNLANLERRGALGILLILNPRLEEIPWERTAASRSQFTHLLDLADSQLRVGGSVQLTAIVNAANAGVLFDQSGTTFDEVLAADMKKAPLPARNLNGVLQVTITYQESPATSPNVVAVFPGRDATLKNEYVLLSAHLDHVGVGDPINGDKIYNGAMDNASGVATLLEVARALRADANGPRRSILLLACTGEEMGLLGSKYFAARPTVPIENVVADINLDMFLPLVPLRMVRGYGVGESDLAEHLSAAARDLGIAVQDDPEPERNIFIRSDQYSFIKKGVPSLFLSVGYDLKSPQATTFTNWFSTRYHAPSDDPQQPIDLESAAAFNRLMANLTLRIANADRRPMWHADSFFRRFADEAAARDAAGTRR